MSTSDPPQKVTVALGGNAILKRGETGTAEEQFTCVRNTVKELVRMVASGHRIVVTHGNGPQVGDILLKNELAKEVLPPMPLDFCGAESQGMIGYMLQQAFEEEFLREGIDMPVVTLLTQTLVDAEDPAFKNPTKPIGPFYTPDQAESVAKQRGWTIKRDGDRGFRRVVPSPSPLDIVEKATIVRLYDSGALVIAAGGGGIPVARVDGRLRGVEAVIDKDRTAALLAGILKTDVLLILTDVDKVYLDYESGRGRPLQVVDVDTMEGWLLKGKFPEGSMGPKIQSAVSFIRAGGKRAVISSLEKADGALAGTDGTSIVSSVDSQR